MAFEFLGARKMAPFFGSGVYVWGAVIAVFMLALSVGYLLGGRLADRVNSLNVPSRSSLGLAYDPNAAGGQPLPATVWFIPPPIE